MSKAKGNPKGNPYVDVYIEGEYYDKIDQKHLIGKILSLLLSEMKYMSEDAMKDNLIKAADLASETLDWKKSASLSKKVNFIKDYLKVKATNRSTLRNFITNLILSSEGLGTLPGFNYGKSSVNAELISSREMEGM